MPDTLMNIRLQITCVSKIVGAVLWSEFRDEAGDAVPEIANSSGGSASISVRANLAQLFVEDPRTRLLAKSFGGHDDTVSPLRAAQSESARAFSQVLETSVPKTLIAAAGTRA
jgi:hypothetical protein